jgi:translation initiation factor IF-1
MRKIATGIVTDIITDREFSVLIECLGEVTCTLSSKAKGYLKYDIILGEEVQIEVSPVNDKVGRIEPRGWIRNSNPPS